MKKFIENAFNFKSLNYYVLMSILLHISLFVVSAKKKEITLGDKLIPVEVLNIDSRISRGDYLIKPVKQTTKSNTKNISKDRFIEKKIQENFLKQQKVNEILEVKKIKKEKIIPPPNSDLKTNRSVGSEGEKVTNQVERGSLKGKGTEKITCLSCIKPKYPKLALRGGYEGIVKLKIWIAKNGKVTDVKIIKSSGYDILDKTGIKAALNSKFYPIKQPRTINIEYNLKINR